MTHPIRKLPYPFLIIALLTIVLAGTITAGSEYQDDQGANAALRAFADRVAQGPSGEPDPQARWAETLRLLAAAIESKWPATEATGMDLRAEAQRLRNQIDSFVSARRDDLQETAQLQKAMAMAADTVARKIGTAAHDEPSARRLAAMRRSADSIDLTQPLRRQPDVVERFFHQAAEVLTAAASS